MNIVRIAVAIRKKNICLRLTVYYTQIILSSKLCGGRRRKQNTLVRNFSKKKKKWTSRNSSKYILSFGFIISRERHAVECRYWPFDVM